LGKKVARCSLGEPRRKKAFFNKVGGLGRYFATSRIVRSPFPSRWQMPTSQTLIVLIVIPTRHFRDPGWLFEFKVWSARSGLTYWDSKFAISISM
jgi:hypothetical protein